MSVYTPNWDKIINALSSTTTTIGGEWANLISDYFNGVDIGLVHPTKKPKIGTITYFKSGKARFLDNDESHGVSFAVDDIDTGSDRTVVIRRMDAPFTTDYMVLEGSPATLLNKDIDGDVNNVHDLGNSAIKTGADIDWAKINKTGSILDDIADVNFSGVASQDIVFRNATNQWTNLPKGGNNTALTVNGSGNLAYALISNSNIDSGAQIAVNKLAPSGTDGFVIKTVAGVPTWAADEVGAGGAVTDSSTHTFSNKTISLTSNSVIDASIATGDLAKSNGTKYVRWPKGTALQVPRVNSGGTDLEWSSLDSERTGKAIASGNGSTIIFNIAHGLGSTPAYAFVDCSSHQINRSWTVDGTNITVTFATAPSSGTNNVIIFWRVIA